METRKNCGYSYFMSFFSIVGIAVISAAMIVQREPTAKEKETKDNTIAIKKAYELKLNLRAQWGASTMQYRHLIISIINSLPETKESEKKILDNQKTICGLLQSCYDKKLSVQAESLFHTNTKLTFEAIEAVKASGKKKIESLKKAYEDNCESLCAILCSTSGETEKAKVKSSLARQLDLITSCAQLRKNKQFEKELNTFDQLHAEYLRFSDLVCEEMMCAMPLK